MRQFVVIALLCLGLSAPAWAEGPSFDCAQAKSPKEKAICASSALSALDMQIAQDYKAALSAGKITAAEQQDWLRYRDEKCRGEFEACLGGLWKYRHDFLSERLQANAPSSPGFDCEKAQSRSDKAICANPDLSALDMQLANAYEAASQQTFLGPEKKRAWPETREWSCSRETTYLNYCLDSAMRDEIEVRAARALYDAATGAVIFKGDEYTPRPVGSPAAIKERIISFAGEKQLKDADARIQNCDHLMQLDLGQNRSFGALCLVDRRGAKTRELICNDEVVGHFNDLEVKDRPIGDREVAIFVTVNCIGG